MRDKDYEKLNKKTQKIFEAWDLTSVKDEEYHSDIKNAIFEALVEGACMGINHKRRKLAKGCLMFKAENL